MAFNCTLRAPHGGIFVLPTIGNPLMYAIAIFIGALVGCLILSFLKKPLPENVEEKKFQLENDEIHNLEQYFKKEKMKLFVSEVKWGRDSEVAEVTIMKRHN